MSTSLKQRSKAILNVYLILKRENQVLLSLRKNTGYLDGQYGLVSGHVEENESALEALIREIEEEIGLNIDPSALSFKGFMHRKTDSNRVDIFFECSSCLEEPLNKEPQKCGEICFFPLEALPHNTIPYIKEALSASTLPFYCEMGWD